MRNYKKISNCPPSVQKLIDAANSLPKGFKLAHFKLGLGIESEKKQFYELISELPDSFIDTEPLLRALLDGKTQDDTDRPKWIPKEKWEEKWSVIWKKNPREHFEFTPLPILNYAVSNVKSIRESLEAAIRYNADRHSEWQPVTSVDDYPEITAKFRTNYIDRNADIQVRNFHGFKVLDGIIEVRLDPTFTVLVNEKIDTRRIRKCDNCENFFWAKRMDAKSCGNKQCVEKLGAKNYHKKNKEENNRKKRRKYYEDNNIKFCNFCIYPLTTHDEADCELNKKEKN